MIKARAAKSNVLEFDPRRPVMLFSAGAVTTGLSVNLAMMIDPIEALRLGAESIRIRLLTDFHTNPTTLDNVTTQDDVLENIKVLSDEITKSHNDFLAEKVLAESEISVTSILSTFSEDLALDYGEGADVGSLASLMPTAKVATATSVTPKSEIRKLGGAEGTVAVEIDFTYSQLEPLFNTVLPKALSVQLEALRSFALTANTYGKSISGLANYPFPIPNILAEYRDVLTCPAADTEQAKGVQYLTDDDFVYNFATVAPVPAGARPDRNADADADGTPNETERVPGVTSAAQIAISQNATLSTAYIQCIALDTSANSEVYASIRQLKRLPFTHSVYFETAKIIPRNFVIEVSTKSKFGVILSKLTKQVDSLPLLRDTSKPILAPSIAAGLDDLEDTFNLTVTQNDPMANRVVLLFKSAPSLKFEKLGSVSLVFGGSRQLQYSFTSPPTSSAIIRAIAVVDETVTSNAFTDVVLRNIDRDDTAGDDDATPPVDDPKLSTVINSTGTYSENNDGTFDVTISTSVGDDGEGTVDPPQSMYEVLFIRKLTPANGDDPDGVPGDDGGFYLLQDGIDQQNAPGGSFVDNSSPEGSYIYVIDADDGAGEMFYNISQVQLTMTTTETAAANDQPIYTVVDLQLMQEDDNIRLRMDFTVSPSDTVVDPDYATLSVDLIFSGIALGISLSDYSPTMESLEWQSDEYAAYRLEALIPVADLDAFIAASGFVLIDDTLDVNGAGAAWDNIGGKTAPVDGLS